ncbi:MAG: DNA (cytosine-5-)-methyltransferase [Planctomycetes bacterium]|nr:DNA (cytosine-5-)-methyltransferase [Planctomycetota bacterium]
MTDKDNRRANVDGRRVTVGSLFAAIGGFCKAFQQHCADILWANEKDRFAAETFRLNFPDIHYIEKPVEDLSVHGDRLAPVDVLTAGFPCQAFSIAGEKKGFKDPRGLLFLHIIRIVREFGKNKPKILLLENVKNLKAHDKGRTFKRIQAEIQRAGYWFSDANARILNTADYTDIPQNRERVFMVAMSQSHFPANTFVFPDPLPDGKLRSVRSFLDLQTKPDDAFYFTPESQYYELFRDEIEKGGREHIYQLRRSYVRKNMSDMCFTLMANMGEGGHNQPVIKDRWGIRKLTPRECARLQGYEDTWFKIPPSLSNTQVYKQIGNSVTVAMVARLAERIVRHIQSLNGKREA